MTAQEDLDATAIPTVVAATVQDDIPRLILKSADPLDQLMDVGANDSEARSMANVYEVGVLGSEVHPDLEVPLISVFA